MKTKGSLEEKILDEFRNLVKSVVPENGGFADRFADGEIVPNWKNVENFLLHSLKEYREEIVYELKGEYDRGLSDGLKWGKQELIKEILEKLEDLKNNPKYSIWEFNTTGKTLTYLINTLNSLYNQKH
jgi:hypothetical protein